MFLQMIYRAQLKNKTYFHRLKTRNEIESGKPQRSKLWIEKIHSIHNLITFCKTKITVSQPVFTFFQFQNNNYTAYLSFDFNFMKVDHNTWRCILKTRWTLEEFRHRIFWKPTFRQRYHDLTAVLSYEIGERIDISGKNTGDQNIHYKTCTLTVYWWLLAEQWNYRRKYWWQARKIFKNFDARKLAEKY